MNQIIKKLTDKKILRCEICNEDFISTNLGKHIVSEKHIYNQIKKWTVPITSDNSTIP